MTTMDMLAIARERQLDWLLDEVLGGGTAARRAAHPWLAAAIVLLGLAAAIGTALLRRDGAAEPAPLQEPPANEWHECHGPQGVAAVPDDVVQLRCFDFDDDAIAALARCQRLTHLDLSGMDVNEKGYSVSLKITDRGVEHLGQLTSLRWLSLAQCHEMKGEGLAALEALPLLEHLDLTYSGVESPAVERLARLPSLRSLSLSHCMDFHGRSLAEVAKIPGLQRLELRACTTVAAADALHLTRLTHLRHLDLRDCQGRFRGQRGDFFMGGAGRGDVPPPPVEDGVGITDAVVAAFAGAKLETLLLGGSESLTDAIGPVLAGMTTLRMLDLSALPRTTDALLPQLPGGLTSLRLDRNPQFTLAGLRRLPALPGLRELGLAAMAELGDDGVAALLADRRLERFAFGGTREAGKDGEVVRRPITESIAAAIAAQPDLRHLELRHAELDRRAAARLAALPRLETLDLTSSSLAAGAIAEFAAAPALRELDLTWAKGLAVADVARAAPQLRQLQLYGTELDQRAVQDGLAQRHGLVVTLPQGQRHRVP
ncbi:MAG: hypothetical protein JNL08_08040 [Planctomycetes bacterium]|nr:hypothetical protein [Planctomycetota bacterium]